MSEQTQGFGPNVGPDEDDLVVDGELVDPRFVADAADVLVGIDTAQAPEAE